MPIFEYRCESCETRFEKLIRRESDEQSVLCPKCGEAKVEKELSTFAAHAHGSRSEAAMPPCGAACPTPGMCGRH